MTSLCFLSKLALWSLLDNGFTYSQWLKQVLLHIYQVFIKVTSHLSQKNVFCYSSLPLSHTYLPLSIGFPHHLPQLPHLAAVLPRSIATLLPWIGTPGQEKRKTRFLATLENWVRWDCSISINFCIRVVNKWFVHNTLLIISMKSDPNMNGMIKDRKRWLDSFVRHKNK